MNNTSMATEEEVHHFFNDALTMGVTRDELLSSPMSILHAFLMMYRSEVVDLSDAAIQYIKSQHQARRATTTEK